MCNGEIMDNTTKKRQTEYRKRMYKAGLKEVRAWVKRKEAKNPENISITEFIKQIKTLTAGMDKNVKNRLFNLFLKIARGRKEEVKLKK